MLTLALAEGGAGESWGERARRQLIRRHPGHFLSRFESLEKALVCSNVQKSVARLREKYPLARVEWMLLAGDTAAGIPTGRTTPSHVFLEELLGPPAEADVRLDTAESIRGPVVKSRTVATARVGLFPAGHSVVDVTASGLDFERGVVFDRLPDRAGVPAGSVEDESLSSFYLGVLFSIALLLSITRSTPSVSRLTT
jgi:hypothetical protein